MSASGVIFDYRSIESTDVVLYSSLGMVGLPRDVASRTRPVSQPQLEEREVSQLVCIILFARPTTYSSTYYSRE
jgi:hypothetical protein